MTNKARQVAKARSWKKIQDMRRQAEYWRHVWKTNPERMRAHLERINGPRRDKARDRTRRISEIVQGVPTTLASHELRPALAKALQAQGIEATPREVTKLLSNLRRRGMVAFDLSTLMWSIKA